ncbi:MAG: internalization-related competence protein ComEC/Rec2 [Chlorobi bacterium]|nr:internalization-related competence protein ComEC/Rec2 [Chlorobiota bacterium]
MLEPGWKYYPALKLTVPFAAGIAVTEWLAPSVGMLIALLVPLLAWLAMLLLTGRAGLGIPLLLSVAVAGGLHGTVRSSHATEGLDGAMISDAEVIGRVTGDPVVREYRVEFSIAVDSVIYRNSVAHPAMTALVRLVDSSGFNPALLPRNGDHIGLAGDALFPSGPLNPGGIDSRALLHARGIGMTILLRHASSIDIISRGDRALTDLLVDPIRDRARAFAGSHVGGAEGGILRALLIGEREYVDSGSRDAFMRTGTIHLLAVSGFNVGLIALVLFMALSWIPSRAMQFLLFVPLLGLYVLATGADPSILRAAVMAAAFMGARVGSRISRPLNTLAFAAMLILLLNPSALFTAGFQLSFASVAGIIIIYPGLERPLFAKVGGLRHRAFLLLPARWLLLSISAQLFTLPFVLYHFGYLPVISLLINMPALPLTSIALGAGAAGTFAGLVSSHLAAWFGGTAYLAVVLVERIVGWGASLPVAGLDAVGIGIAGGALLLAGIVWLALSRAPAELICRMVAVMLLAGLLIAMRRGSDPLLRGRLLFLLHARNGIVPAVRLGDTLTCYSSGRAGDSALEGRDREELRRRIGAGFVREVDIDTIKDAAGDGAFVINDMPREVALAGLPVIISKSAARTILMVMVDKEPMLLVPLGTALDRGVVLAYDGVWRSVEWRDDADRGEGIAGTAETGR